jgi:hypothetical protein
MLLVVTSAAMLAAAACGQTVQPLSPTSPFSPLPSPSLPTSLPPQLAQSFCEHLGDLQETLASIQASPTEAASRVHTALSNVSSELQADQQQLQSAGQTQLASFVQNLITALNTANQSIPQSGSLPSGISAVTAVINGALQQIPPAVCPSPTT